jgi:uncharacterized protein DUF3291
MIEMPWEARAEPDPGRDYLAIVTYLPMRRLQALPRWVRYIRAVQKQLARATGLVGYSLRTNPLRLRFWTLSVWEDEDRLREFLRDVPHANVMREFGPKMAGFGLARWTVPGTAARPSWRDALSRL